MAKHIIHLSAVQVRSKSVAVVFQFTGRVDDELSNGNYMETAGMEAQKRNRELLFGVVEICFGLGVLSTQPLPM